MVRKLVVIGISLLLLLVIPAEAGENVQRCHLETQECIEKRVESHKRRGWAGIVSSDLTESGSYWVIRKVYEKSPAGEAGLQVGDVIYKINGIPVVAKNSKKLQALNEVNIKQGDTLEYVVDRNGERLIVSLNTVQMPLDILATYIGSHLMELHLTPGEEPVQKRAAQH